jgi:hypothetical protein
MPSANCWGGALLSRNQGAYLLTLWGLPHGIVEAVARHHTPRRVESAGLDPVAAVHVADLLVAEQEAGACGGSLDLEYLAALGVADRVDSWRALAAEHVTAAGAR